MFGFHSFENIPVKSIAFSIEILLSSIRIWMHEGGEKIQINNGKTI